MKVLYIGQYTEGTTSKMRAATLNQVLNPEVFKVIDTHVPFYKTSKIWRSLGFRYQFGPLVIHINRYIIHQLKEQHYDLIWVDKAVFITKRTTKIIREKTSRLVHSTPDMAFYANQSKLFNDSLGLYDFCITTKTKELDSYARYLPKEKVLFMPQGYSKNIHRSHYDFSHKDNAVVFIGLAEKARLQIAEAIVSNGIKLKLVGFGWDNFVKKHKGNQHLEFFGRSIYGENYSKLISSSKFGLGLLSKRFPELHTTRTFEIPACGTALLTEKTTETEAFFNENEVVFYNDENELIAQIQYFLKHQDELEALTKRGRQKVHDSGYDYTSIISKTLREILN